MRFYSDKWCKLFFTIIALLSALIFLQFLSSSSFFLYWYWLSCYRQEQSREPLVKSDSCHSTDCENCCCASTSTSRCSAGGVDNPVIVGLESEGYPAILGDMSDLEPLHDGGGVPGVLLDVTDSVAATSPLEDNDDDILSRIVRTEEEDQEEEQPCPISNNPYLPGNSMTHSKLLLNALHFPFLVEWDFFVGIA